MGQLSTMNYTRVICLITHLDRPKTTTDQTYDQIVSSFKSTTPPLMSSNVSSSTPTSLPVHLLNPQEIRKQIAAARKHIAVNQKRMDHFAAFADVTTLHTLNGNPDSVHLVQENDFLGRANALQRRHIAHLETQLLRVATAVHKRLHEATIGGNVGSMVMSLVDGANLHTVDEQGNTVLHLAAMHNQVVAAHFLLCKGLDVDVLNRAQESPLHVAARYGHSEVLKLFLHWEANSTLIDNEGRTPLAMAQLNGDQICVQLLSDALAAAAVTTQLDKSHTGSIPTEHASNQNQDTSTDEVQQEIALDVTEGADNITGTPIRAGRQRHRIKSPSGALGLSGTSSGTLSGLVGPDAGPSFSDSTLFAPPTNPFGSFFAALTTPITPVRVSAASLSSSPSLAAGPASTGSSAVNIIPLSLSGVSADFRSPVRPVRYTTAQEALVARDYPAVREFIKRGADPISLLVCALSELALSDMAQQLLSDQDIDYAPYFHTKAGQAAVLSPLANGVKIRTGMGPFEQLLMLGRTEFCITMADFPDHAGRIFGLLLVYRIPFERGVVMKWWGLRNLFRDVTKENIAVESRARLSAWTILLNAGHFAPLSAESNRESLIHFISTCTSEQLAIYLRYDPLTIPALLSQYDSGWAILESIDPKEWTGSGDRDNFDLVLYLAVLLDCGLSLKYFDYGFLRVVNFPPQLLVCFVHLLISKGWSVTGPGSIDNDQWENWLIELIRKFAEGANNEQGRHRGSLSMGIHYGGSQYFFLIAYLLSHSRPRPWLNLHDIPSFNVNQAKTRSALVAFFSSEKYQRLCLPVMNLHHRYATWCAANPSGNANDCIRALGYGTDLMIVDKQISEVHAQCRTLRDEHTSVKLLREMHIYLPPPPPVPRGAKYRRVGKEVLTVQNDVSPVVVSTAEHPSGSAVDPDRQFCLRDPASANPADPISIELASSSAGRKVKSAFGSPTNPAATEPPSSAARVEVGTAANINTKIAADSLTRPSATSLISLPTTPRASRSPSPPVSSPTISLLATPPASPLSAADSASKLLSPPVAQGTAAPAVALVDRTPPDSEGQVNRLGTVPTLASLTSEAEPSPPNDPSAAELDLTACVSRLRTLRLAASTPLRALQIQYLALSATAHSHRSAIFFLEQGHFYHHCAQTQKMVFAQRQLYAKAIAAYKQAMSYDPYLGEIEEYIDCLRRT